MGSGTVFAKGKILDSTVRMLRHLRVKSPLCEAVLPINKFATSHVQCTHSRISHARAGHGRVYLSPNFFCLALRIFCYLQQSASPEISCMRWLENGISATVRQKHPLDRFLSSIVLYLEHVAYQQGGNCFDCYDDHTKLKESKSMLNISSRSAQHNVRALKARLFTFAVFV